MSPLLRFLFDNPILIFILVAWVVGAIGNAAKAAKKAQQRQGGTPPRARPPAARPASGPRSAEEVAAEIRRALGLDPTPTPPQPRPPVRVEPQPVVRRNVVAPERPPAPVVPTTQNRRLEIHVEPHVGEAMARQATVGQWRSSLRAGGTTQSAMGQLGGGRELAPRRASRASSRFALGDLGRAVVLTEILGAPLALREPRRS